MSEPNVLDGVDRPIRELVIQMNRIGLSTVFSCCGYPYPDEEEPKSHAYKNAYVIFKKPATAVAYFNFDDFTKAAHFSNWKVDRYHDNWRIDLKLDSKGSPSGGFYIQDNTDRDTYSLHDYEMLSLGIYSLTQKIKSLPTIGAEVRVVDGNHMYHEMGIDWQIKPKPDAILHFEEIKETP